MKVDLEFLLEDSVEHLDPLEEKLLDLALLDGDAVLEEEDFLEAQTLPEKFDISATIKSPFEARYVLLQSKVARTLTSLDEGDQLLVTHALSDSLLSLAHGYQVVEDLARSNYFENIFYNLAWDEKMPHLDVLFVYAEAAYLFKEGQDQKVSSISYVQTVADGVMWGYTNFLHGKIELKENAQLSHVAAVYVPNQGGGDIFGTIYVPSFYDFFTTDGMTDRQKATFVHEIYHAYQLALDRGITHEDAETEAAIVQNLYSLHRDSDYVPTKFNPYTRAEISSLWKEKITEITESKKSAADKAYEIFETTYVFFYDYLSSYGVEADSDKAHHRAATVLRHSDDAALFTTEQKNAKSQLIRRYNALDLRRQISELHQRFSEIFYESDTMATDEFLVASLEDGALKMPEENNFTSRQGYIDNLVPFYLLLQYFVVVERDVDKAIAHLDYYLPHFIEQPVLFEDLPEK